MCVICQVWGVLSVLSLRSFITFILQSRTNLLLKYAMKAIDLMTDFQNIKQIFVVICDILTFSSLL